MHDHDDEKAKKNHASHFIRLFVDKNETKQGQCIQSKKKTDFIRRLNNDNKFSWSNIKNNSSLQIIQG